MRDPIEWRRIILGIIAVVALMVGGLIYVTNPAASQGFAGILVRLGLVLGAFWLAWPQMQTLGPSQSLPVVSLFVALLLVAVIRPRLFFLAFILVVIGFVLNWGLRWLSAMSDVKIQGKKNHRGK